jgi:hypothetical protein
MEGEEMTWLAASAVVQLAFDPTLNPLTTTLKTALGNLFAIGLMVGAVYYLFVARRLSKAITFGILGAVCALFFDVGAIQSAGAGIKTLLGL